MAFGNATFTDASSAAGDIFQGIQAKETDYLKAQGDFAEASNYGLAATLAQQNEQFTETSTAIKEVQAQRAIEQGIGTEQAQISGAGFQTSGSAIDLLAASAQQGALQKAVLSEQGLITEAGYTEQAHAYQTMQQTALATGQQEEHIGNQAMQFGEITGAINAAAAVGTLFTGGPPGASSGGGS
jgi:hypothetical protein